MDVKIIKKRWVPKPVPDKTVMDALCRELGISPVLSNLIAQRKISNFNEARMYFNPGLHQLHDPFGMKDMEKATSRIREAINRSEKITIYGDYDVDGTTSVALVHSYFSNFHHDLNYYIPNRFREGYGISKKGVDYAVEQGAGLMIALDCGIKAVEVLEYARKKGLDVIICDHHTPGDILPPACAILNPKQPGCDYPYKELSGCGIGYKLISAYEQQYPQGVSPENYLDLVAISIAADIVPVTGENRILAHFGIQKINTQPMPGVRALMDKAQVKHELNISDVVFKLGPRINAAGRMAEARQAVKMLISQSVSAAHELADVININNTERKDLDVNITEQALSLVRSDARSGERVSTVLYNKDWHKGIIGIVASRLIENYYRPTILLTESNGLAVGSARSVPGFDLYSALSDCQDLFIQYGGHFAAAGLTMEVDRIPELQERFEEAVAATIDPDLLIPTIEYDLEIPFSELNPSFCNTLKRFGPFGPQNMQPVFISRGVKNFQSPRVVGDKHLKLHLCQSDSFRYEAIGFKLGQYRDELLNGKAFDICYTVEENTWNNKTITQLNIKDIQTRE